MASQEDHDLLVETNTVVKALHRELTDPGGRVPRLEEKMDVHGEQDVKQFGRINEQLSYWKGAIALVAFLLLALGGTVMLHILEGGGK